MTIWLIAPANHRNEQVARADSLREITDAEMVREGINDQPESRA
jgi:hypothetical protein